MPEKSAPIAPDTAYAVAVHGWADVHVAAQAARRKAVLAGFPARGQVELAIVATELCTNILRHAGTGELRVRIVDDPVHGRGVEAIARDSGRPIRDLVMAMKDGCDDVGPISPDRLVHHAGLGSGLGAIARMTHVFEHTAFAGGKEIRVVRFVDLGHAPRG